MSILRDWMYVLTGATASVPVNKEEKIDASDEVVTAKLKQKVSEKKEYLLKRGKCSLTQNFKYTTSASTNVEDTWRDYVRAELPSMTETYKFLFR